MVIIKNIMVVFKIVWKENVSVIESDSFISFSKNSINSFENIVFSKILIIREKIFSSIFL